MCTSPIRILNRSKWIRPDSGQSLYMYVPCGHCIECRNNILFEWRTRTYYECLDTINNNGYCYFDTLTYRNDCLPRLSDFIDVPRGLDFPCFRNSDVQLFVNRLRTFLSRPYKNRPAYDVADNLRYFYAFEYGTSELRTKRPHVHIILFVRNNAIPVFWLSHAVGHCWTYGRTDGLPYKSTGYIKQHNTITDMDNCGRRVVSYVSKYVAKDFEYSDLVRSRLYRLMCAEFPDFDWQMSRPQREYYKMLCRFVMPCHHQSLHYGDSYLNSQNVDSGYLKFNFDGLPVVHALFASTKRKVFYNRKHTDDGYTWYLNARGIRWKQSSIVNTLLVFDKLINDYNLNHETDKIDFSPWDYLFNHQRLLERPIVSVADAQELFVQSNSVDCYNGLRNYAAVDYSFIHKPIFTRRDFGSKKNGYSYLHTLRPISTVYDLDTEDFVPLSVLERHMIFDQSLDDAYFKLFEWRKEQGKKKMALARLKEHNKKKLKHLIY